MNRVLIIEDDPTIRRELCDLLQGANYEPLTLPEHVFADNAEQQVSAILDQRSDLLLLDIGLTGINGKALLRELRKKSELPVIMVTGNSAESDEVLSMSYGADDFVTKPYNPDILLLRIAAILRRASGSNSNSLTYHSLRIDLARGMIEKIAINSSAKPRRVLLTKNEMVILRHLLDAHGQIVTREALMTDLWDNQEYINDNALTVNISRLRTKLRSLDTTASIETRKGLGYILV